MKRYQCETCRQMKNENEFYKDNRRALGIKTDCCKQCRHEKYLKNREKKIDYQIQWNYENYEKCREYMNRYLGRKNICC